MPRSEIEAARTALRDILANILPGCIIDGPRPGVDTTNGKHWPHLAWTLQHPRLRRPIAYKTGLGHGPKPNPERVESLHAETTLRTYLRHASLANASDNMELASLFAAETKRKGWKPDPLDILASVLMDSAAHDERFEDWCDNYGYSSDSITARETYDACCEQWHNLCDLGISPAQIETARTLAHQF